MLFILIAAIALALGAAGLALMLPRLFGIRPPRWVGPLAGGVAMFAFMLWNEYTWYERSREALGDRVEIVETYPYSSWLQPWTLIWPRISRFAAIDTATARTRDDGLMRADVMLVGRFSETVRVPQVFDCEEGRRADIRQGADPSDADALIWRDIPDDPLVAAACGGGTAQS